MSPFLHPLLALFLAPFLFGVINKTKAFFAGRKGVPLLQAYHDVYKLLRKGAVYSRTTTWIFRAGPVVGLCSVLVACSLLPWAGNSGFSFAGDFVLFIYLLGLMRFFTILAALDTGSSFEGMGASREAWFSTLAEIPLFLCIVVLVHKTGCTSISTMYTHLGFAAIKASPGLVMVILSLFVVLLTENARVPIDDPNTHLELTMIHEVMVLDHGGPDFAFILCGSVVKFWAIGTLVVGMILPFRTANAWVNFAWFFMAMILLSVATGIIESIMARIKLSHIPKLLMCAGSFAILALFLR